MARRRAPDAAWDAAVREAARASDLDRYLAALLAPRRVRGDLIVLTAFLGEAARVGEVVSEPMMGEVRLQWWRDALASRVKTGHPVADALMDTIARHDLPEALFHTILDARARDLDPHVPKTEPDLEKGLRDTEGAALQLAARILAADEDTGADDVLAAAAQAWGRVRLLRALPASLAKGRNPLPGEAPPAPAAVDWQEAARPVLAAARSWLKEARLRATVAPAAVLPAILPLALVEPYLAALERLGPNIARERADISPLTRVWRLWRASALGRV
jgi:phytoene synthase